MRKSIMSLQAVVKNAAVHLTWNRSTPHFQSKDPPPLAPFRIYRQAEDDFTFGQDYAEYFLGLRPDRAELLHDGDVPLSNHRKYEFIDTTAARTRTYAYFVQPLGHEPCGPIPVRVRDPEVCWSYQRMIREAQALAAAHPRQVQCLDAGISGAGRTIPALRVGHRGPILGLVGLVHAGESGPELIIPALSLLLETHPELFEHAQVLALPALNVDARELMAQGAPWYLRTTPLGIDLNRSFPANWHCPSLAYGLDSSDPQSITYRGPGPAVAPETQTVMNLFTTHRPSVVLSFHWLASICGLPALASELGAADAPYADACQRWTQLYGRGLYPDAADLPPVSFHCCNGSLSSWLYLVDAIPCLDLEGGANPEPEKRAAVDQTSAPLLHDYQHRHVRALAALLTAMNSQR